MYRILCISPYFAPRADSEAFCGSKFILELRKLGNDVNVLSLDPTSPYQKGCDDSKLWEPLKEITVNITSPAHKDRLSSARWALRYRTMHYARWIKKVVDTADHLHQKKAYDVVYSRSLPIEAHIAGYWVSRRLHLPWVANINDPWDWHVMPDDMKMEYPLLQRTLSTYWMKKTLGCASLVTYPSARLRDYHSRISGVEHRSEIIRHIGYRRGKKENDRSRFCIVHTGKLGGLEVRSPHALLKGIQGFLQENPDARKLFRMVFVGREDPASRTMTDELGLQSVVEHTGRVSYERSLEYIDSATVCVLVEGKLTEGIFLPSKLADYLAAGKPVLALSPRVGVISDMLMHTGVVRVDVDDVAGVKSAIGNYYRAFILDSMNSCAPSDDLIRKFRPETVAARFLQLFPMIARRLF